MGMGVGWWKGGRPKHYPSLASEVNHESVLMRSITVVR